METLERLAGRVAHAVSEDSGEMLESANLIRELAEKLAAFSQQRDGLAEDESDSTADQRVTVLVVEQAAAERASLRELLGVEGCAVLEAADAAAAIETCREHRGVISVLLTNVLLDDMSGRELAERVALLRPEIHVVYTSGYTDDEIVYFGILGPGMATLRKPVSAEALREKLQAALSGIGLQACEVE
jgi:CheY-like chemotaxis protein